MVGVMFDSETLGSRDIVISDAANWMFNGTGIANGAHLKGLLGYEADRTCGWAPPQIAVVARSPYTVPGRTHYAEMATYQTGAGSTVVATGTMQWSWGLDNIAYEGSKDFHNPLAQQVTRNILARLIRGPAASQRQP